MESWPQATLKRRALAWYLDYLMLGAPWAVLVWLVGQQFPVIERLSFGLRLALLVLLETVALRLASGSPGHWLLGVQRLPPDRFAGQISARYVVSPRIKSHERWWTVLFGVLAILDGSKTLVRWTMWTPPIPFLGLQLDEGTSMLVSVLLGALEWAVGIAALRLSPWLLVVGLPYYGLGLATVLLSWELWPDWIGRYIVSRREFQGLPVRPDEIEAMQAFAPPAMVVAGALMALWLLLVVARCRRAREG